MLLPETRITLYPFPDIPIVPETRFRPLANTEAPYMVLLVNEQL